MTLQDLKDALENAPPFMLAAAMATRGQLVAQRIVEAVIIGALSATGTGLLGWYVALPVLENRLANLSTEVASVRREVGAIAAEVAINRRDADSELRKLGERAARVEERTGGRQR